VFSHVEIQAAGQAGTFIVFVDSSLKLPQGLGRLRSAGPIVAALTHPDFSGADGAIREAVVGNRRVVLVGVDPSRGDGWVRAAAVAGRRISQIGEPNARFLASRANWHDVGVSLGLLAWNHTELKGSATTEKSLPRLTAILPSQSAMADAESGLAMAESVNIARNLSQLPPNIATPAHIAHLAREMAQRHGLKCDVIRDSGLESHRLAGLINVGRASVNAPCLIRLEYRPKGATGKPLVLLGKTITYDTGGLSLKDRVGMIGMKRDKDGGCAVLGAMHAIATVIKPNRPVIGLLVAAENSVSGDAYRADDVITFRNGVTVEVTNTDAEGRLVLADGLCWACDEEDPCAIVDVATLTGGVVTALGKVFAGCFSRDGSAERLPKHRLEQALFAVATRTGERVWPLPLDSEYRELMKSPVADIVNSNANRQAHPVQGATFLSYFVKDDVPWVHLDIAGVHATEKDRGPIIPGPTGFGVRLLAELAALI
jgi:leucyl aminopeptidase